MPCQKCETLPDIGPQCGLLFIWPASAHTQGKIGQCLLSVEHHSNEYLTIPLQSGELETLGGALKEALTSEELRQSKALLLDSGKEPSLADIPNIKPLAEFLSGSEAEWLRRLLKKNRLTSYLQPIVYASSPKQAFGHEALLRAWDEDNKLVNPARLFQVAIDGGLLFQLDRMARESAVKAASNCDLKTKLFINFTPTSIYDPENCLRTTLKIVDDYGFDRSQIVFEVIETEKITDVAHLANVLNYYRDNGFQVALDDLGGGYSALSMLPDLKPDFVKIDRALITNIHENKTQAVVCQRIVDLCHDLEIQVVAEGIETVEEESVLLELGVDFMQGYYYGKPQALPLGHDKEGEETERGEIERATIANAAMNDKQQGSAKAAP